MIDSIRRAIHDSDRWVVEFNYHDSKGRETRRIVSPIRFLDGSRFLGLCLGRAECRQFYLNRCHDVVLRRADEYLMPVPILDVSPAHG